MLHIDQTVQKNNIDQTVPKDNIDQNIQNSTIFICIKVYSTPDFSECFILLIRLFNIS